MTPRSREITSLPESFACAATGIREASGGRNFRIELSVGVLAMVLGMVFGIDVGEWIAVIGCIGLVLGGECMNTALEAVVDLASPEWHELARRAKDAAAGAVLLFSAASLAIGIIVFAPRMLQVLAMMG